MRRRTAVPTRPPKLPAVVFMLASFFLLFCPQAGADDRQTRREAGKVRERCDAEYLKGKFDQALEDCLKYEQLMKTVGNGYIISPIRSALGALYARKGDMKRAYNYWIVSGDQDDGTMGGITDLQARLAAQRLASYLERSTRLKTDARDVDLSLQDVFSADGLAIILRTCGFGEQANKVDQEATKLRRDYAAADRASRSANFSALMMAIATGLSGAPSGAGRTSPPSATSPADSGNGNQSAQFHNECIARDPEPWNPHDNKTVAVLKLRNTCSMPLTVMFCHKSPSDPCWKCEQIGTLQPGESASSPGYPAGCTTTNCGEVQAVFNAVAGPGGAPKPYVNDSCNAAVH
jgi:hypothetical protein